VKAARALAAAIALAALAAGCEQETRRFVQPPTASDPRAQALAMPDLQPGQHGPGMRTSATVGGFNEQSAFEIAQGKRLFRWFNCAGCHSKGGGGMGPALMDDQWIYGRDPDTIFATIMDGRPNGMPSFRGRIPEGEAWQIVSYVRSMSGMAPNEAAPNRADDLGGAPPENRRKPEPPREKKKGG